MEQRVPENGVDCQPDTVIVKIAGQFYAIAFLDTGSAKDFCTKSFARKFMRQFPGQTSRVIQMGHKKVRIPVYELGHKVLNVHLADQT